MSSKGELSSAFSVRDLPTPSDFNSHLTQMPAKRQKTFDQAVQSGNVFIWGQNDDVTDFDDEQPRRLPYPVKFFKSNAVSVACGSEHVLILSDDGRVYSWGQNNSGALGRRTDCAAWVDAMPDTEFDRMALPQEMEIPSALGKVQQISAGEWHSAGLLQGNMFWISGSFYSGQNKSRISPGVEKSLLWQLVGFKDTGGYADSKIVKISSGGNHVIVLMENGEVWGLGYSELGQLGTITEELLRQHATHTQINSVLEEWEELKLVTVPIKLKTPEQIQDIFTGNNCTFVKGQTGKIYACGVNGDGMLALAKHVQNGDTVRAKSNAHPNGDDVQINQGEIINADDVQINQDGNLNGDNAQINQDGNLNGDNAQINQGENLNGDNVQISQGENLNGDDANLNKSKNQNVIQENQMMVDECSNLNVGEGSSGNIVQENQQNQIITQRNVDGSSGNQTNIGENSQISPQLDEINNQTNENVVFEFQKAFSGLQIDQISCGSQHTLALTSSGKMYACGNSQDGCLGIITTKRLVFEPTLVANFSEQNQIKSFSECNKKIKFICAGAEFSGCVDGEGTGYLWGNGEFYKMGNMQEDNVLVPMKMKRTRSFNQEKIIDMSLGYRHGVVISINKERFSL